MQIEKQPSRPYTFAGLTGRIGLVAGGIGVLASSCCLLPILLVGVGLGSVAASVIPTLSILQPYLLSAGVISVAAAWISLYWRHRHASAVSVCASVAQQRILPLLIVATLVVAISVLWRPLLEPRLLLWFR